MLLCVWNWDYINLATKLGKIEAWHRNEKVNTTLKMTSNFQLDTFSMGPELSFLQTTFFFKIVYTTVYNFTNLKNIDICFVFIYTYRTYMHCLGSERCLNNSERSVLWSPKAEFILIYFKCNLFLILCWNAGVLFTACAHWLNSALWRILSSESTKCRSAYECKSYIHFTV